MLDINSRRLAHRFDLDRPAFHFLSGANRAIHAPNDLTCDEPAAAKPAAGRRRHAFRQAPACRASPRTTRSCQVADALSPGRLDPPRQAGTTRRQRRARFLPPACRFRQGEHIGRSPSMPVSAWSHPMLRMTPRLCARMRRPIPAHEPRPHVDARAPPALFKAHAAAGPVSVSPPAAIECRAIPVSPACPISSHAPRRKSARTALAAPMARNARATWSACSWRAACSCASGRAREPGHRPRGVVRLGNRLADAAGRNATNQSVQSECRRGIRLFAALCRLHITEELGDRPPSSGCLTCAQSRQGFEHKEGSARGWAASAPELRHAIAKEHRSRSSARGPSARREPGPVRLPLAASRSKGSGSSSLPGRRRVEI